MCHSEAAKTARNPLHLARVAQVGGGSLSVFAARDDTYAEVPGAAPASTGGYTLVVVRWERFDPDEYDISFNDEKLAAHGISRYDVMEVLENGIYVHSKQ